MTGYGKNRAAKISDSSNLLKFKVFDANRAVTYAVIDRGGEAR